MPLALNGSVERKEREVPTKLVRDGEDFIYSIDLARRPLSAIYDAYKSERAKGSRLVWQEKSY